MRKVLLVLAMLVGLCSPAMADGRKADVVERAIELSGIMPTLESFSEQLGALMQQRQLVSENPEAEMKVYEILKDSYDVVLAKQYLFNHLKENADTADLEAALQVMESPLLRRITAEEMAAAAGQTNGDMLRYLGELQTNSPTPERILLIQKLVDASRMSETATDLAMTLIVGIQQSVNLVTPEEKRMSDDRIDEMTEQLRTNLEMSLRQQMIYGSFYTYRNVSDADLAAYVNYLQSDTGQNYTQAISEALVYVFSESFAGAGDKVAALAKEARKATCNQ